MVSPLDCLHHLFPGSLGAEHLEATPSPEGLGPLTSVLPAWQPRGNFP